MGDWNLEKKQAFVARMGKKRPSFARGGLVRRKRFAVGGAPVGGPGITVNPTVPITQNTGFSGSIANALGTDNEFQALAAPLQAGTNASQINNAYGQAQQGIAQQQGLVQQVTPGGVQGVQTQAALNPMLLARARGEGPNPAAAALAQRTAENVANQAAMQAGQRGANQNVGLIARQAAQQGASTQQQSVQEAATLEAQQQIAAQQEAANLAAQQVGQQAGAVQGVNNAAQNEQNIIQGANTALNAANVTQQGGINATNAQVAAGNAANSGSTLGGILGAVGGVAAALLKDGGEVVAPEHLASGGAPLIAHPIQGPGVARPGQEVGPWLSSTPAASAAQASAPSALPSAPEGTETLGSSIKGLGKTAAEYISDGKDVGEEQNWARGGRISQGPHRSHVANFLRGGEVRGKVPAMVSPGELWLSPDKVKKVVEEGANPMKLGQKIPGKAKRPNDSLENDTVPMDLEEGGVVIPRHITKHKMAREKAELFVHRAIARKKAQSH